MKYAVISLIIILFLGIYACDRDEVFEKEQYKNVFALISGSNNVSTKYHKLGAESTGYVAASCGGTNPIQKDIVVNLVEDQSLIDKYNTTNYDVDVAQYARPLPKGKYDIDSYQFTIPAGEIGGKLPIRIRPDGLCPDSTYMIALRVDSHSTYEANPDKNFVLYMVRIKNYWAQSDGSSTYYMKGKIREKGATAEIEVPGTKTMFPIGKNKVRIMAGNETYESNIAVFNKAAIVLEIDDKNKVTISPYKSIVVHQIDGDSYYPNIFKIEDDGYNTYKTFLLHYDYTVGNTTYEIKEELRLEFDAENEVF